MSDAGAGSTRRFIYAVYTHAATLWRREDDFRRLAPLASSLQSAAVRMGQGSRYQDTERSHARQPGSQR